MKQFALFQKSTKLHLVPLLDTLNGEKKTHILASDCDCKPEQINDPEKGYKFFMYIHRAFDKREFQEPVMEEPPVESPNDLQKLTN